MGVKFYVSRDPQGQPWPPDYGHEVSSAIDLIKRLWLVFNHQNILYAAVTNLHKPNADLVIISERGFGVIELKHYPGRIFQQGSTWYAQFEGKKRRIKAGSENQGYRNPYEQVQAYTEQIREKLFNPPPRQDPWLPGSRVDWQEFKFSTAVCFTHPEASIEDFRDTLRHRQQPKIKEWEKFTLLKPAEVPDWAAALRFDKDQGQAQNFRPYHLTKGQIVDIATRLLRGTEWTEIANLMPTGEPYAYLTLIEDGRAAIVFNLDREEFIIGRNPTCDVIIPDSFARVGREHARITRSVAGIFIEDLASTNGTFINSQPIRRQRLKHSQRVTLGGPAASNKVCLLEFSLKMPKAGTTEAGTGINYETFK